MGLSGTIDIMTHFLETLNTEQREAVVTTEGALLIVAGAGTGKTKTLTSRIAYLIEQGVSPKSILAVTFTNKAAKEMRERIAHLTNLEYHNSPLLLTFHSLGVYILRNFGQPFGVPKNFRIIDIDDCEDLIKEALEKLNYSPKQYDPRTLQKYISKIRNENKDPGDMEEQRYGGRPLDSIVKKVYPLYEEFKKRDKSYDFDDLLVVTRDLIKKNKDLQQQLSNTWKYVHIDEYQDTNELQYELADLLVQGHGNICVVGDGDQTIYSWRGATIRNILQFSQDFPGAKQVILKYNYRSTKSILDAAHAVVSKNVARIDKELLSTKDDGKKIQLAMYRTDKEEAGAVLKSIKDLLGQGISEHEIAVLYRTNAQSRALEEAAIHAGINYSITGVRFFDRKEIKDIVGYLRLLLEPTSLVDIKRVVNVPTRGIGPASVAKIISGDINGLSPKARTSYEEFNNVILHSKKFLQTNTLHETVLELLKKAKFLEQYSESNPEDLERLQNIDELINYASQFGSLPGEEALILMLDEVMLMSGTEQSRGKKDDTAEQVKSVSFMTIHSAKGLEFTAVFIVGLEEGIFPSMRAETKELEEERRLMYVAITRAKEELFLSYCSMRRIYGQLTFSLPSQFITDIPHTLIESVTPAKHQEKSMPTIYFDDF